jgi:hypothetical protein
MSAENKEGFLTISYDGESPQFKYINAPSSLISKFKMFAGVDLRKAKAAGYSAWLVKMQEDGFLGLIKTYNCKTGSNNQWPRFLVEHYVLKNPNGEAVESNE